tara:strand:- start:454 stop:621 length:168 start_codon:yes stop_codon:yes gene_type:complete
MTIILHKAANPNISKQAQELEKIRKAAEDSALNIKRAATGIAALLDEDLEDLDKR